MTISIVNGVNPLQTTLLELGIVSGRVALLLRSAEIQPVFGRFSMNGISHSPPPWLANATGRFFQAAVGAKCYWLQVLGLESGWACLCLFLIYLFVCCAIKSPSPYQADRWVIAHPLPMLLGAFLI
jgi:hypothetical protein